MTSKAVSPTARILRYSRLFSLPPPLPRPSIESYDANGARLESETATLPYPIRQVIETTPEGLHRGEWGLKRALPLRQTQNTSTPVVRVLEVDSIDHVTDYESAADHYVTLRKWQEMNIPIFASDRDSDVGRTNKSSALEQRYHNTARDPQRENAHRWKYEGPDVDHISPGEFHEFVTRTVKGKKKEFRRFVQQKLERRLEIMAKRESMDTGETVKRPEVTRGLLDLEINRLRRKNTELYAYIWEFLDLPGEPPSSKASEYSNDLTRTAEWMEKDHGAPSTHPTAGLGYVPSGNIMHNHPVLGPMRYAPPVEARILRHGKTANRSNGINVLGVGGITTRKGGFPTIAMDPRNPERNQESKFDHRIQGGAKAWVTPQYAKIDHTGRINLQVERTNDDSVAVWEHRVDKEPNGASPGAALGNLPARFLTLEQRREKEEQRRIWKQ